MSHQISDKPPFASSHDSGIPERGKCLCNPHAEPNAPREPNCPIHSELARCDREIEEIQNRPDFLTAPSWLLTLGMQGSASGVDG